jgi:hypothetical protein
MNNEAFMKEFPNAIIDSIGDRFRAFVPATQFMTIELRASAFGWWIEIHAINRLLRLPEIEAFTATLTRVRDVALRLDPNPEKKFRKDLVLKPEP